MWACSKGHYPRTYNHLDESVTTEPQRRDDFIQITNLEDSTKEIPYQGNSIQYSSGNHADMPDEFNDEEL